MTEKLENLTNRSSANNNKYVITDYSICHFCNSTGLKETDKFCLNCRFPQRGTEAEIKRFFYGMKLKKDKIKEKQKAVKKARNILFILAGINLLYGIVMGLIVQTNILILIVSLIGASIYFGLGMWSRVKPFPAILSGFFIYIVFIAIAAIGDPHTIYQGIIWKVIIISAFIYGYKAVKESESLQKELILIKSSKDLSENNEM